MSENDAESDRYGVPRCPVDGQWCSTCRVGKGNGTGGQCARTAGADATPPLRNVKPDVPDVRA